MILKEKPNKHEKDNVGSMDEMEFIKVSVFNRSLMMRTAMSILRNETDSEDAVQETLFRCWQHLDSLRYVRKMRSWLLRCLTN